MIRIENITVEKDYFIKVIFSDGTDKLVDLSPLLTKGVFKSLQNPDLFAQIKNHSWFISWPGELELSADTLYYC
jgi:hypothetical protein